MEFGRRDCGGRRWLKKPFHGVSFSLGDAQKSLKIERDESTCASVSQGYTFLIKGIFIFSLY